MYGNEGLEYARKSAQIYSSLGNFWWIIDWKNAISRSVTKNINSI